MALPFLAIAALATTAVSTGLKVAGAIKTAKAEKSAALENQQNAYEDMVIARQQALQEAGQIDRENRLRKGAVVAAVGSSGVLLEGSVLDALGDIVAQGELQRQDALYQGELRARGYIQTQEQEGRVAKGAMKAGYLRAGSSLLSGASQLYTQADTAGFLKRT